MAGRLRDWLGRKCLGLKPDELLTVKDLTREFTALKLEWAETLDFIQHWASRQAKRDQRSAKRQLEEPPAPEVTEVPQMPVGTHSAAKAALRQRAAALRQANGGTLPIVRGEP